MFDMTMPPMRPTFDFNAHCKEKFSKPYVETELGEAMEFFASMPLTQYGPWLGGGAARRAFFGEPITTDLDLLFRSAEQFDIFVMSVDAKHQDGYKEKPHLIEFNLPQQFGAYKVQAMRHRWFDSPWKVIEDFDYSICQFVFDGGTMYCGQWAITDHHERRLRFTNPHCPVSTIMRAAKYGAYGFKMDEDNARQIAREIARRPELVDMPIVAQSS